MSADRLREAAKVLREQAEAATPGPWRSVQGASGDLWWVELPNTADVALDLHGENATYIATMHPGVGLALADWLDDLADHDASDLMPMERGALFLADLILGSAS